MDASRKCFLSAIRAVSNTVSYGSQQSGDRYGNQCFSIQRFQIVQACVHLRQIHECSQLPVRPYKTSRQYSVPVRFEIWCLATPLLFDSEVLMSGQDSLRALQDMFPAVETATLQATLQACNFNIQTAVELTLGALEASPAAQPGAAKQVPGKKPSRARVRTGMCLSYHFNI